MPFDMLSALPHDLLQHWGWLLITISACTFGLLAHRMCSTAAPTVAERYNIDDALANWKPVPSLPEARGLSLAAPHAPAPYYSDDDDCDGGGTDEAGVGEIDLDGISNGDLERLRENWAVVRREAALAYGENGGGGGNGGGGSESEPSWLALDPLLSPRTAADADALLLRYLRAERNGRATDLVGSATDRLRATLEFRREYGCTAFHRAGAARALLSHDTNPAACQYFVDCGLRDRHGEAVLVGRFELINGAGYSMEPANHLRSALFVIDRAVAALSVRRCRRRASYVLDLGAVGEACGRSARAACGCGSSPGSASAWDQRGYLEARPVRPAMRSACALNRASNSAFVSSLCVRARARACVRACVRARARACVRAISKGTAKSQTKCYVAATFAHQSVKCSIEIIFVVADQVKASRGSSCGVPFAAGRGAA